jgi:hypothetical protein
LVAGDAFEAVEEVVECLAGFEGVEEVLDGDSGGVEARRAADALGVDPDEAEEGMAGLDEVALEELGVEGFDVSNERLGGEG